jgi:Ca2+/Na+ antiporter
MSKETKSCPEFVTETHATLWRGRLRAQVLRGRIYTVVRRFQLGVVVCSTTLFFLLEKFHKRWDLCVRILFFGLFLLFIPFFFSYENGLAPPTFPSLSARLSPLQFHWTVLLLLPVRRRNYKPIHI